MSAARQVREVLNALLDAERTRAVTYRRILDSLDSSQEAAARAAHDEAMKTFVARYGEALDALEVRTER